MKILHLSPSYFDAKSVVGGGERYVYELARNMAYCCDTTFLSFGEKREEFNDGLLKVKIYPLAGYFDKNRADPIPADLAWVDEIKRADVIHFYQRRVEITGLALQYAFHYGRKTFVTDLGGGGHNLMESLALSATVDGWLPISKFAAGLTPPAGAGKTRVVYGGVNTDFFKPLTPGMAFKKPNRICYVGRLLPHKGVDNLIKAVTPDMELHLVGHPYNPAYLDYLEELSQGKNVRFFFDATDQTILEEYQSARVSVLPSVFEDVYGQSYVQPELLGLVLLEAQSCGTPVVATRVASLPEVVNHKKTGLLVEPNDPAALREALRTIIELDEPDYSRMSQAARRMVETKFTWPEVVKRCLASYRASFNSPAFSFHRFSTLTALSTFSAGLPFGAVQAKILPVRQLQGGPDQGEPADMAGIKERATPARTVPDFETLPHQEYTASFSRVSKIMKLKPDGKLLDTACGAGGFLRRAKEVGFEACGLDPDSEIARQIELFSGCPVYQDLSQLKIPTSLTQPRLYSQFQPPPAKFDIITCSDYSRFSDEGGTRLGELRQLLGPGGLLVLEVKEPGTATGLSSLDTLDNSENSSLDANRHPIEGATSFPKGGTTCHIKWEEDLDRLFRQSGFQPILRETNERENLQTIGYYLLVPHQGLEADREESCDFLFITNLYPPYYIGGYEMMCHDTVEAFEEAGHRVLVLTGRYGLDAPQLDGKIMRLLATGIANPQDSSLATSDSLDGSLNAAMLRESIRWLKPQKVILFNTFGINSLAILNVLEDLHVPRLIHLCDMHLLPKWNPRLENPQKLKAGLLHPEMRLTSASRLITGFYNTFGFTPGAIKVIYSNLDTSLVEAAQVHTPVKSARYSVENPFKILYAGQIYREKGVELVIEAVVRLVERFGAHASLAIIGEGDKSYITLLKTKIQEAQERLGITLRVEWPGFKPRPELFKTFYLYDAFVLGSTSERPEPFGLVALEAMAMGLPVVVPDFSGVSEVIEAGVNGLIATIDQPDSFAEALHILYQDPELAFNISRQARLSVLENFTNEKIVNDFLSAFS